MRRTATAGAALGTAAVATLLALVAVTLAIRGGLPLKVLVASPDVAVALVVPLVGGLIATRHPSHPIAWVLLAAALCSALYGFGINVAATLFEQGWWPGLARWLAWLANWIWYPSFAVMFTLLLLLFPDGRLPSSRWRPVAIVAGSVIAVETAFYALSPGPLPVDPSIENPTGFGMAGRLGLLLDPLLDVVWPLTVLASLGALLVRWLNADRVLRLQLQWVAVAGAVGTVFYLLTTSGTMLALLVPAACLIAILRHSLFDIDRVTINFIVYGALALLVVVLHGAVVLAAETFIVDYEARPIAPLTLAAVIAVLLFQPAHEHLDRLARRIVYGRQAVPYDVVSDLSQRLASALAPHQAVNEIAIAVERAIGVAARVTVANADSASSIDDEETSFRIEHRGEVVGRISLHLRETQSLTRGEQKLLRDLAAQSGPAVHNVRLHRELQQRLEELEVQAEELRESRTRLVSAQDEERRRVERDLHDGIQQRLLTLSIQMGRLASSASGELSSSLLDLQGQAESITHELRRLARGMYPAILTDLGLEAALRSHIDELGLPVRLHVQNVERYPEEVETASYFTCVEAITNATRHAHARLIDVSVTADNASLSFSVVDDGRGFDIARSSYGSGLLNMRDRLAAIGGSLRVESSPGRGTTVTGIIPLTTRHQISGRGHASEAAR